MFHFRVNGGEEQRIPLRSGAYMLAAAAVPAALDLHLPVDIEIWVPDLVERYGPHFYRIELDRCGDIKVIHLWQKNLRMPCPCCTQATRA